MRPAGVVLTAAALFRLAYFLVYRATSPYFDAPYADGVVYDRWARALVAGTWDGSRPFYFAPGYAYALAFLYRHASATLVAVYVVQLVLGLVTLAAIHRLASDAFGRRAGVFAAALAALYAPLPFLEMKILSSSLGLALLVLSLTSLTAARTRGGWWRWAIGGWLLGTTSLVRPEMLILSPFLLVWLARWGGGRRVVATAVVFAAWALAIAPAAVHNLRTGGGATLISSQGGLTFYQSNNERAAGFYVLLDDQGFSGSPETQEQEDQTIAERALGRTLTRSEATRYWFGRGFAFITARPGQFIWLLGQKLRRYVGSYEWGTEFNLYVERESIWLLWLAWVPFALLVGLALPGLVRRPLGPTGELLLATLAANLVGVLMFYMSSRYRLAAVPALVALGGRTLDRLVSDFRADRRRFLVTAAVVAAIVAVTHPEWSVEGRRRQEAASHCATGRVWSGKNEQARARTEYEHALAMDPTRHDCWYLLGIALRGLDQPASAARAFGKAIELRPGFVDAHVGRGLTLEAAGDLEGARAAYETAWRMRPDPALAQAVARLSARLGR
jgi:tetratricopeptide (TPR) repeat protein